MATRYRSSSRRGTSGVWTNGTSAGFGIVPTLVRRRGRRLGRGPVLAPRRAPVYHQNVPRRRARWGGDGLARRSCTSKTIVRGAPGKHNGTLDKARSCHLVDSSWSARAELAQGVEELDSIGRSIAGGSFELGSRLPPDPRSHQHKPLCPGQPARHWNRCLSPGKPIPGVESVIAKASRHYRFGPLSGPPQLPVRLPCLPCGAVRTAGITVSVGTSAKAASPSAGGNGLDGQRARIIDIRDRHCHPCPAPLQWKTHSASLHSST